MEFNILIFLFSGCHLFWTVLEELVIVIQSQKNSFHAQRGYQRKEKILQDAANLGEVIFFEQLRTQSLELDVCLRYLYIPPTVSVTKKLWVL